MTINMTRRDLGTLFAGAAIGSAGEAWHRYGDVGRLLTANADVRKVAEGMAASRAYRGPASRRRVKSARDGELLYPLCHVDAAKTVDPEAGGLREEGCRRHGGLAGLQGGGLYRNRPHRPISARLVAPGTCP